MGPELSTLTTALKSAGLLNQALSGKGPFTVFAPSNDAFAKLGESELQRLLDPTNLRQLQDVLGVHVTVGATLHSEDLQPVQNVKSLEGKDLSITNGRSSDGNEVRVGFPYQLYWPELPAKVIRSDIDASNAVVHIIDIVLMPPPANVITVGVTPEPRVQALPAL